MQLYGLGTLCHYPVMILLMIAAMAAAELTPPASTLPPASPPTYPGTPAKPKGNPGDWVTAYDYPAAALRYQQEGIVGFRLLIDRSGNVSDCTVTQSSTHQVLDMQTCNLLRQRALFTPARDINGNAVEGHLASRVRWAIPIEDAPLLSTEP